jgi:dihydropteroate synthase
METALDQGSLPVAHGRRSFRLPRGRVVEFGAIPLVMGIINVTPDSFSDGGVHFDCQQAVESAMRMIADGAAIIDVGGESTRPGAEPVDERVEIDRVLPVIEAIRERSDAAISIDTMKASVARQALDAGADLVNDVTALRYDPEMKHLLAGRRVPVILMHMRGEPRTMQQDIHFDDVVKEVGRELQERVDDAAAAGIERAQIAIDPGIGFGKTFEQNLLLLRQAGQFTAVGPLVIGASRKAFVGQLTGRAGGPDRAAGSLAAVAAAAMAGAAIVRVHDVRQTVDFLKVFGAIR